MKRALWWLASFEESDRVYCGATELQDEIGDHFGCSWQTSRRVWRLIRDHVCGQGRITHAVSRNRARVYKVGHEDAASEWKGEAEQVAEQWRERVGSVPFYWL